MRGAEAFRVAIDALRANRVRSLLTMLGVIIGVAAVVVLVAIGSGAKREVEQQVEGLGSNLILVVPGRIDFNSAPSVSRLQLEDVEFLGRVVGDTRAVATTVSSGEAVRVGSREVFSTVNGVNENVPYVFNRPLARGGYISRTDVGTRRRVAVLGAGAADKLFGVQRIDALAVKAPSTVGIEALQTRIVDALQDKYEGDEFSAVTQTQILGTIGRILGLLTGVLAAIAAISLLVGGVGVSNIMLVSVRERTREIGLRKALGARQRDILLQFLVEAVLLTTIGGVIGIALGVGGSLLLEATTPLPAVIAWWSPALAFGVSAAVGVFFGVVPARRAGRLDPVIALRTD